MFEARVSHILLELIWFGGQVGPGNPDKVREIRINVKWLTGIRSWTGQIGAE